MISAAIICSVAISCAQQPIDDTIPEVIEDIAPEEGNGTVIIETITAGVDVKSGATRSEIGATGIFTWNEGDNVAYHVHGKKTAPFLKTTSDGSGDNGRGAYDLNAESTEASFDCAWGNNDTYRDAFAVYPAYLVEKSQANYGQSGMPLDVTLPSSYTFDECGGDKTPCPMIATNDSEISVWDFKQVCGLLRVTVNNVPPGTDNLTVTVAGKDIHGAFSIASPVTPGTSVVESKDGSNSTISITGIPESDVYQDNIVVNLPLPIGAYDSDITVICYDDTTIKLMQTIPFSYTASRARGKKVKVNLAGYTVNSTGLQVGFAPGNLQARISSDKFSKTVFKATEWRFASAQYEYLGTTGNSTFATSDWVDLFCFTGESAKYDSFGLCTTEGPNANAYGETQSELLFSDWGENVIGPYPADFWRTSTASSTNSGELNYMLTKRSASTIAGTENARYAKGNVNGINGLILFPDIYVHPDGVADPTNINDDAADFSGNDYTVSDWTKMEQMGCIFLPAAGQRNQKTVSRFSGDAGQNVAGFYRINLAAPSAADNAYRLAFTAGLADVDPVLNTGTGNRHQGFSVRLQRNLP